MLDWSQSEFYGEENSPGQDYTVFYKKNICHLVLARAWYKM